MYPSDQVVPAARCIFCGEDFMVPFTSMGMFTMDNHFKETHHDYWLHLSTTRKQGTGNGSR
jgi:hypothetical protein